MKRLGLYAVIVSCWILTPALGFTAQWILAFGPEWLSVDTGPAVPMALFAIVAPLVGAAFWATCKLVDMNKARRRK